MQRSGSLQRQFGAVDLIWYFFLEMNRLYTIVYNLFMIEVVQTDEFARWLKRLKDAAA